MKIAVELTVTQAMVAYLLLFILSDGMVFESSVPERQHDMKRQSMSKAKDDIPELTREQLGKGVRGKYFSKYSRGSNVVVLKPELQKAFPTSEAVNKALASVLAFAEEAKAFTTTTGKSAKRKAA